MPNFVIPARRIRRTGDMTPARSLLRFVWRMSGWHQIAICAVALVVAALSMAPLELQRQIVNGALDQSSLEVLLELGAIYLVVVIVQTGLKYILRVYQGWLSESAVRYCRRHLSEVHHSREASPSENGDGEAVSVIGPEIDKLGGFVGEGLAQPCVNLGMIVAITGYMIVVEPMIALFSLPFIVPQLIVIPWMQTFINRLLKKRVMLLRQLSDSIAELAQSEQEWRRQTPTSPANSTASMPIGSKSC